MTRHLPTATLLALLVAACSATCQPKPPGPNPPPATGGTTPGPVAGAGGQDAGPPGGAGGAAGADAGTPCDRTMAHLVELGCVTPVGAQAWALQCAVVQGADYASIDLGCLDRAQTKAAVQACRSVVCP